MGITHSAPQYNATKRIKWLFFAVVVTTLGAIAAWFGVANAIDRQVSTSLEQHRQAGGQARCDNQAIRGFPFRFGVFCDAAAFGDGSATITVGAVRSAAQFYNPNHIIVEADGPLTLRSQNNATTLASDITLTWQTARIAIQRATPLPRRASLAINQPRLELNTLPPLTAQALTAHMRALREGDDRGGETGDIDVAAQITAPQLASLLPHSATLADVNIDLDATLKQAAARWQAGERDTLLADATIKLHRLAFILNDDSGILADGTLTTDNLGRLSGNLDIRLVDVDDVVAALGRAFPQHQPLIGLLANLPKSGPNNDEATLSLSLDAGRASFGFIPLGTVPPLL